MAARLASFDRTSLASAKSMINRATLPPDAQPGRGLRRVRPLADAAGIPHARPVPGRWPPRKASTSSTGWASTSASPTSRPDPCPAGVPPRLGCSTAVLCHWIQTGQLAPAATKFCLPLERPDPGRMPHQDRAIRSSQSSIAPVDVIECQPGDLPAQPHPGQQRQHRQITAPDGGRRPADAGSVAAWPRPPTFCFFVWSVPGGFGRVRVRER